MSAPKPEQTLGGISLIELAVQQAISMSDAVAIAVQRKPEWPAPEGVDLLYDTETDIGPLSALSSALEWGAARLASHVLVIPCDMPFLPADLLTRLTSSVHEMAVAMAKSEGRVHPICALWSIDALSALPEYVQNSRRSLIGFAERLGMVEVEWDSDPVDPFFNVNTPDDLASARRLVATGIIPGMRGE